jgi:hypothetical protein
MPDPKPLVTVKQAAAAYQKTERTIWTWVAKGAVPSVRVGGSRYVLLEHGSCATHTSTSTD